MGVELGGTGVLVEVKVPVEVAVKVEVGVAATMETTEPFTGAPVKMKGWPVVTLRPVKSLLPARLAW